MMAHMRVALLSRPWTCAGRIASLLTIATGAALVLPGCAPGSYEHIRLGQTPAEYRSAFVEGSTHQTTIGIWYRGRDANRRNRAVVLLTAVDQRVAGKLQATWSQDRAKPAYHLVGELSPELLKLGATGPLDVLRVVVDDLTGESIDRRARAVHDLVAAGLVRILRRWPCVDDPGPAATRLAEAFQHVPAGGRAGVAATSEGTLLVEYSVSAER